MDQDNCKSSTSPPFWPISARTKGGEDSFFWRRPEITDFNVFGPRRRRTFLPKMRLLKGKADPKSQNFPAPAGSKYVEILNYEIIIFFRVSDPPSPLFRANSPERGGAESCDYPDRIPNIF